MNICVFYYDAFCESEIVLSLWGAKLHKMHNIFSVATENRVYISEERQKFLPDKTIDELKPEDIDLFIIPGGDPTYLFDNDVLRKFMKELNNQGKYIAGICGGSELMAKFEVLDNKKCTGGGSGIIPGTSYAHLFDKAQILNEDIVIDGNAITATGQSFVEFSIEMKKIMNIYENEDQIRQSYNWLKNIKE